MMAQFDIYEVASKRGYLVDCQSMLLSHLSTRTVVPLLPLTDLPRVVRLNPVLKVEDENYLFAAHLLFAIPKMRLGKRVSNLEGERDAILRAIDVLWSGI